MIIPFIFFVIFIIIYVALLLVISWHIKKYAASEDKYSWVNKAFFICIILFLLITIVIFFMVPWEDILSTLNQGSYVPTKY